jgi:histidyl-tRNA synthetase
MAEKKSPRIEPRLVKGMRDQLGGPILRRQRMLDTIRRVFERFGFRPLETPVVEFAQTLTGSKAGETSQRIFTWHHDEDDVDLGLRFDLTVPLARFVAGNPYLRRPFKRYQTGSVFRVDKPGAGRFREFTQFDIDVVGTPSMLADAEILVAMGQVLEELGLPDYTIRWNHRGILNCALRRAGIAEERAAPAIRVLDKEDKIGAHGVRAELGSGRVDEESGAKIEGLGLPVEQIDGLMEFLDLSADDDDTLLERIRALLAGVKGADETLAEIDDLRAFTEALGAPRHRIRFAPRLARGMDYYTGPIFEATLDAFPHFGSIMGGGRYNELVSRFSSEQLPAVGASIGVDRLLAALEESRRTTARDSVAEVLVTTMDRKLLPAYLTLVRELREVGFNAEIFLKPKAKLGDQLKYASDWGIPFAVILGEDEVASGQVTVKDLEAGKQASEAVTDREQWVAERPGQFQVARTELAAHLRHLLDGAAG